MFVIHYTLYILLEYLSFFKYSIIFIICRGKISHSMRKSRNDRAHEIYNDHKLCYNYIKTYSNKVVYPCIEDY